MSYTEAEKREVMDHQAACRAHNRAMMDEHAIPRAARRGFQTASMNGMDYIVKIEERDGRWIVTTSFTADDSSSFSRHGWIIGPRGKATKAY